MKKLNLQANSISIFLPDTTFHMRTLLLLFTLTLLGVSCKKDDTPSTSADKPSEQKTINLTIDGNARSFIVYLPTGYNNAGKMPLIFVIHGGSGTPEGMINIANFKPIADRDKVVLVYPAGIQKNWNDGRPTTPNQLGINDVSFFNQMCDYMITNHSVDGTKIYATGISNGGFMSSRLGCELSNRIAAIAVDAATIEATTISPSCSPGRPVPSIYIHGTTDPLVPFTGGQMTAGGTAGGTILSHFQAIDKWVVINGCNPTPIVTDLPDIANDGTTIKQRVYSGGANGSEVVSYVVLNGGHTWPQGLQYLSESIIGKTSQDINACEVIWSFFKRFKRQ
jgi:polyhydroxybutyrate depolymerase